jgi:tetratricopeptide (TPR) repeat protein
MPLFGGNKRPKLDGLTRDEEKRRDALNPEVLRRSGEKGVAGQAPAAAALLREKMAADPGDHLWPLLLGWQMMSLKRYSPAIEAFSAAVARAPDALDELRCAYGAGAAYFEAAEAKLARGDATTEDVAPPEMTVENLYHEALRSFRRALELTNDGGERDQIRNAIATVERGVARKAGRL